MRYRHVKSGAVIDIPSELIDKDWEPVEAPSPVVEAKTEAAKPAAAGRKIAAKKTAAAGSRKK